MEVGKYVDRRLHPVRVALGLMNHEIELARGEQVVTIDREVLRSIVETFSLFVEDFEENVNQARQQPPATKKFVAAVTQPQQTQSVKVG